MKTTDFTGEYDYEKEEAYNEADYLIENFIEGVYSEISFQNAIRKVMEHWKIVLDNDSYEDFVSHFNARFVERGF